MNFLSRKTCSGWIGLHLIGKITRRLTIVAVALALPVTPALAGDGGVDALESIGLLTIETWATDRVALYNDGVFGVPASTNPSDPDAFQWLIDEDKFKCELDQSIATDPLIIFFTGRGPECWFL